MFYYTLDDYQQLATAFPELLNTQICEVSAVAPQNQTSVPGNYNFDVQTIIHGVITFRHGR